MPVREGTLCASLKGDGSPCKAYAQPGKSVCLWHDESPEARAKHLEASRRGGQTKAYGALTQIEPLSADANVSTLDLATADGLRRLMAATLAKLAELPFDVRIATCLGQIATAQRGVLADADFEKRLAAIEASMGHQQ